jgi:hypothetical protein
MWLASTVVDLAGFLGALALARPFFLGEAQRVTLLLALWGFARDIETNRTFTPLVNMEAEHLARRWPREVRSARIGISLIALAFLGKIIITLAEHPLTHGT